MTKPLIKLPSVELREAREALDKAYADLEAEEAVLADRKAKIADKEAKLADCKAEIDRLRKLLAT